MATGLCPALPKHSAAFGEGNGWEGEGKRKLGERKIWERGEEIKDEEGEIVHQCAYCGSVCGLLGDKPTERKSTGRHTNWTTTNWATQVGQLGDNDSIYLVFC